MDKQAEIARLFVKCQHHRDRAWKAHIDKKDRLAIEEIALLHASAKAIMDLLAS